MEQGSTFGMTIWQATIRSLVKLKEKSIRESQGQRSFYGSQALLSNLNAWKIRTQCEEHVICADGRQRTTRISALQTRKHKIMFTTMTLLEELC